MAALKYEFIWYVNEFFCILGHIAALPGSKYLLESKFYDLANAKIALLQSPQNLAKCYSVSVSIQFQVIKFVYTEFQFPSSLLFQHL